MALPHEMDMAKCFWKNLGLSEGTKFEATHYRHLVGYFDKQIRELKTRLSLPPEDTVRAISFVVAARNSDKTDVQALVSAQYPARATAAALDQALEKILKIWTMLDLKVCQPRYYPRSTLVWGDSGSAAAVIRDHFDHKAQTQQSVRTSGTIDTTLTAACLWENHGVQIVWTPNLAEHLTMNEHILKIFEHKIWAWNHFNFPDTSAVPHDVLEELILTWNLLFPAYDSTGESLLVKSDMIKTFYGLGYCKQDRVLEWDKYKYWNTEIQHMSDLLGESQQGLWKSLVRPDKKGRNTLDIAGFWIAGVVVALLTIVSCVCAVLSLKYALEQKDIGQAQLDLETATACADPEMAAKIPKYCA
ncbi:hypothetical protein QBC34DRAFT_418410 [Podospora aff. communis PSN243]|uniref:Uncharacterized protein n=1 Tax=Podospora aff. communis PSN243 TaxID=3040156 RepID=A0AAV9G184_9PEZI|nr:hypothetical protein QBC34DRAFT_418410 [Podospora aff. communis PSN243]